MMTMPPSLAAGLSAVFSPLVLTALVATAAGVASMLIYRETSPQSRLAELSARLGEARSELHRFDGTDVRVVWSLTRQSLVLSLKQVALVAGPTALAVTPVLLLAWALDSAFDLSRRSVPLPGPEWLGSGHAAFWGPLCLSALVAKLWLKIK